MGDKGFQNKKINRVRKSFDFYLRSFIYKMFIVVYTSYSYTKVYCYFMKFYQNEKNNFSDQLVIL